jgi:signal transduction histidine kinase
MDRADWFDVALAAVVTGGAQTEIWAGHDLAHVPAAAVSTALITVPLAVRRRWPVAVGALALATLVVQQVAIGDVEAASAVSVVALVVAIYSMGAHGAPLRARVVCAVGAVGFEAIALAKGKSIGDLVFVSVVLFAPFIGGSVVYARRERELDLEQRAAALELDSVRQAREAVEEERARIARELHDVVAHAMSVIVVQAGAERHVLPPEQESTRAVLEAIEHTSRQALGEMRRLLGMMRADAEDLALAPQPSLVHLPDLCQQMRSAGLPVALDLDGELGDLPPGVDVSAYRIVQEALTNALKHAGPASARVTVRQRPGTLDVEVVDDGIGSDGAAGDGHGLVGMRERVTVYGGRLETGNVASGGYAVRVHLPLGEPA